MPKKKKVVKKTAKKVVKKTKTKKITKKKTTKKSKPKKASMKKCSCCGLLVAECTKKAMKNNTLTEPTLIAFPRASDNTDTQI